MALTFSNIRQSVGASGKRHVAADVAFDSSYTTGGMAVSLAAIGLNRVSGVKLEFVCYPDNLASTFTNHGRQVVPVLTNVYAPLLKVYNANNTEASNASDQSQVVSRVVFEGY